MTFDEFYTTHRLTVQRTLRAAISGLSPETEEDLTQKVFLKAWQAWARVDPAYLSAWVSRIARNTAIDALRGLQVQRRYMCAWDEEAAQALPDPDPHVGITLEVRELLAQALAHLSQKQQAVLSAHLQGSSRHEIAVRQGLEYSTCCKRLGEAQAQMRNHYQALGGRS